MFCPKCGLQNADDSKFCRACGTDLVCVIEAIEGKPRATLELAEKHISLFARAIRLTVLGLGFLIMSGFLFIFPPGNPILWIYMLAPAFFFLSAGVSRFVQARALKALSSANEPPALASGQTDYIKPLRSAFATDELPAQPMSVTDRTTRHLPTGGE